MTSGKDRWNKNVFSCRRNEYSDWADVTLWGRLFHKRGAATGESSVADRWQPDMRHHQAIGVGGAEWSTTKHIGNTNERSEVTWCLIVQKFVRFSLYLSSPLPSFLISNKFIANHLHALLQLCTTFSTLVNFFLIRGFRQTHTMQNETNHLVSCTFGCQQFWRSLRHTCTCMSLRCWRRTVSTRPAFLYIR